MFEFCNYILLIVIKFCIFTATTTRIRLNLESCHNNFGFMKFLTKLYRVPYTTMEDSTFIRQSSKREF